MKVRTGYTVLRVLVILVSLVVAGCGGSNKGTQEAVTTSSMEIGSSTSLNATAFVNDIVSRVAAKQATSPGEWAKFLNYFDDIVLRARYDIELRKVRYLTRKADGTTALLSGLIILPRAIVGSRPAVPILMFQHGTEPYRLFSPSQYLVSSHDPLDYPEVLFAAGMAATGMAVVMPDYEGLGDDAGIQPFVHADSLAGQVVDMLRTGRDMLQGNVAGFTAPCTWNGKLFLMGYSEGGFATLAATRKLQTEAAAEFTVTAVAPLSGPHDLSGTMRNLILADTTSKNPYYLPFVLSSYYGAYRDPVFSPSAAMVVPYSTTLPPLFTGGTIAEDINRAMGMSYDPVNLVAAKSILTTQFLTDLTNPAGIVTGYLRLNDTYRNWTPRVPIRMYHNPSDDLVPFANSQTALDAFVAAGSVSVELISSTDTVNLGSTQVPSVHVAAALPELHDAWKWFADSF